MKRIGWLVIAVPVLLLACETPRVLVMNKTAGFRHGSIEAGAAAIQALGAEHGFEVTVTEDATIFTAEQLAGYDVVVFNNTTGDMLDPAQEAAMESYVRAGGGFVGIHAATDTEYDWAWYGSLVGARFAGHGPVEPGTLEPFDRGHVSTRNLPARWERRDEWYRFKDVVPGLHVLVKIREPDGSARPIAWCHEFDGGRAWYTGGGHLPENFEEPLFVEHLHGGIVWAMGEG